VKFLQVMGECRSERPRKQTAPGFRKGELTGCGSVTPHTTKAALTSSVLFLPVLRTLKGDFTRAAKGAVSPGVHIVIFSCDAFLLRISFR
jgi:hypothetical protein